VKRIIWVPQYPTPMRYQEWWFNEFKEQFEKAGLTVYTLGRKFLQQTKKHTRSAAAMFSPIEAAIEFETEQIKEYMNMDIRVDDILFVADISFPGFFSNVLHHKRPNKCFAYCHATSLNAYDYFEPVRDSKYGVETGQAKLYDEIFIGSHYHRRKLQWPKTNVVRLPFPPFEKYSNLDQNKSILIASAARPTKQKVDLDIERNFHVVRREQVKGLPDTWEGYYTFLSMSKILLVTAHEETFGYQIVDAVMNNCVPLAPNRCSYPELLPGQYIYNDLEDLKHKIRLVEAGKLTTPKLLCEKEMKLFYQNIIQRMV
jgi:hypothetical protein